MFAIFGLNTPLVSLLVDFKCFVIYIRWCIGSNLGITWYYRLKSYIPNSMIDHSFTLTQLITPDLYFWRYSTGCRCKPSLLSRWMKVKSKPCTTMSEKKNIAVEIEVVASIFRAKNDIHEISWSNMWGLEKFGAWNLTTVPLVSIDTH